MISHLYFYYLIAMVNNTIDKYQVSIYHGIQYKIILITIYYCIYYFVFYIITKHINLTQNNIRLALFHFDKPFLYD